MMFDVALWGWLAVAVAIVGGILWVRPRSKGTKKASGVGDIGQHSNSKNL